MSNTFVVKENVLSSELADRIHSTYCNGSDNIKWNHRGTGRFYTFMTQEDILDVLEHMYHDKSNPFYKNKTMVRNSHIYIQRLVPGGYLPLHREKVAGVMTTYLTPDDSTIEWENTGAYEWWSEPDHTQVDENSTPDGRFIPKWNQAVMWLTSEQYELNPYHRVTENLTNTHRYSIQCFFSNMSVPGGVSHKYSGTENQNFTVGHAQTGGLELPNLDMLREKGIEWINSNSEIIEQLESQGKFLV